MVTETINSFKDNIHRRVTNPFLGTFTFVYIVKNWVLFYGIFNFDSSANQLSKIEYINKYFQTVNPFWNILFCVLYSLGILIATYMFMAISKLIVDAYGEMLVPKITKLTNKGKIVERSKYIQLQLEKDMIELQCEKEKEERVKAQKSRDENENKYLELKMSDKSTEEVANLKEEIQLSKFKIDSLANDLAISKSHKEESDHLVASLKKDNDNLMFNSEQNISKMDDILSKMKNIQNEEEENARLIARLKKENAKLKIESEQNNSKLDNALAELSSMQSNKEEKDNLVKRLSNENKDLKVSRDPIAQKDNNLASKLYLRIKIEKRDSIFEDLFKKAKKGESVRLGDQNLDFFLENNLISLTAPEKYDNKSIISFTDLGNRVYNLKIMEMIEINELKSIYKEIVDRFPIGRLAAHLINNNDIKRDEIIEELYHFTMGNDSDRAYTDEDSRYDAKRFIDRLNEI